MKSYERNVVISIRGNDILTVTVWKWYIGARKNNLRYKFHCFYQIFYTSVLSPAFQTK